MRAVHNNRWASIIPGVAKERQKVSAGERSTRIIATRWRAVASMLLMAALLVVTDARAAAPDEGGQTVRITGDRLSGFVLPVAPLTGDIILESRSAHAWTVDDTKRLVLSNDVRITIAGYEFTTDHAVIWLNRIPSADGVINQIALYANKLNDPTRRAGSGISGDQPLITASTRGEVTLRVTLMRDGRPSGSPLLTQGEGRLADHLKLLLARETRLRNSPKVEQPVPRTPPRPIPGGNTDRTDLLMPDEVTLPAADSPLPPLFVKDGQLRFRAGKTELITGEDENVAVITDSVVVEYISGVAEERYSRLTISADKAVIFTDPGPLEDIMSGAMDAENVRGVYLEGDVIATVNGDEYVIRTPRAFYDFQSGQAVMVDAILRTYRREDNRLIYVRAKELRQIAANQWEGTKVVASTSEFFRPTIALGAGEVVITQQPDGENGGRTYIESRHNTLNLVGVPVAYWPKFSGTTNDVALRGVNFNSRNSDGFGVETRWDLYTLLGVERPKGTDLELRADGYSKRGGGGGVIFRYDLDNMNGVIDLYGIFDDGTDRTSSGLLVDQDEALRGAAIVEHTMRLTPTWWLQAQGTYISDPSFITAWREDDFVNRREYESSLYLKYQSANHAFTALAKGSFNDFLSNSYLLASQGYSVEKFPEVGYHRYGDSFFNDTVTYSTRSSVTRMRMLFERSTPAELGVPGSAFGIGAMMPVSTALAAAGLHENIVTRFDTRHELAIPTTFGPFKIVPFVVGRLTGYDPEFEAFASEPESFRAFASAGVRVSTQIQRIDNTVDNQLFDLHRMRHIIEPSVTAWVSHTTVDERDLPVYDLDVEGVGATEAVEFALRNTWQTQRGGPGRWRSVDVLVFEPALVLTGSNERTKSPVPQFYEYWPEYSQFGNHAKASASWLISDSLTLGGTILYDLDIDTVARGSIGIEMRHSPDLTTYVEYRTLDISDTELLEAGINYQLTRQYRFIVVPQWDFRADQFRAATLRVVRSFPDFDVILTMSYDSIRDETSYGASIRLAEF